MGPGDTLGAALRECNRRGNACVVVLAFAVFAIVALVLDGCGGPAACVRTDLILYRDRAAGGYVAAARCTAADGKKTDHVLVRSTERIETDQRCEGGPRE